MFESVYAPINLFLAGLLTSLLRERTGALWIPIGMHWTWNLTQELSGFATSGFSSNHAILQFQLAKLQVPNRAAAMKKAVDERLL
jgi:uncharacterized protein